MVRKYRETIMNKDLLKELFNDWITGFEMLGIFLGIYLCMILIGFVPPLNWPGTFTLLFYFGLLCFPFGKFWRNI